ncbi:hypothetical protein GY45DRAFT_320054 [Cubamyces sp. BRFM 1775]|nr:hypothetical protein GY45DRAFT_320054 [Cubamyces sp. BRFM 1775]
MLCSLHHARVSVASVSVSVSAHAYFASIRSLARFTHSFTISSASSPGSLVCNASHACSRLHLHLSLAPLASASLSAFPPFNRSRLLTPPSLFHSCSLILPSLPDFTWHVVRPRSRVLVGSTLTVSGPTSAIHHPPSPPPSSPTTHFHHAPAEARILPHGSDVIAKSRRDRNLDALHSGSPVFGVRL